MRKTHIVSDQFVVAAGLAAFLAVAPTGPALAQEDASSETIEVIIVTAEKRGNKSLQDTALSAAVITGDLIDARNLVGMDDYLRTVPGVTFQEYGAGRSTIIIRGISADPQLGTETTGLYLNETPMTGTADFGSSSPDLKLIDIDRIEVLRGPQGTLYGSSSAGGTVRVITKVPRADRFSGSLGGILSHTGGAGSGNASLEGVINIPLIDDVLAIRAVGYDFDNSGYFRNVAADDPVTSASAARTGAVAINRDDVGSSTYVGGRVAARWTPSDAFTLDVTYLEQKVEQDGNPYGDLTVGTFEQARYTRLSTGESERNNSDFNLFNLAIDYSFDSFRLVSSTSWTENSNLEDYAVGRFMEPLFGDDAPLFLENNTYTDSFVQELRVNSEWDHPIGFLVGAYYEDKDLVWTQFDMWDGDPAFDPFEGALKLDSRLTSKLKQTALFGEVFWDVSESMTLTVGARRYDYEDGGTFQGEGLLFGGSVLESADAAEKGTTYKLNLSYAPGDESIFYAQWAQGFNPGSPQGEDYPDLCDQDGDGLIDGLGLAPQSQITADQLNSYELGSKLSFANGRVDLRGALFYNQWEKFPIGIGAECAFIFFFNAGEARTTGFEFEANAILGDDWRLDLSAGYVDAELTSDAPGLGADGDRLPGTPKYNATLGLNYDFQFRGHDGFARADLAAVGGFYNNLQEQGVEMGDYTTLNLSTGLRLKNWNVSLFAENLTNADAATWITPYGVYTSAYRLRPRTIGVEFGYRFEGTP